MRVVIPQIHLLEQLSSVHPHTGVWVEIMNPTATWAHKRKVHPHTGMWVEMLISATAGINPCGSSPCGGVGCNVRS